MQKEDMGVHLIGFGDIVIRTEQGLYVYLPLLHVARLHFGITAPRDEGGGARDEVDGHDPLLVAMPVDLRYLDTHV